MDQITARGLLHERFKRCEKFDYLCSPLTIPFRIFSDAAVAVIICESESGDLCVLLTKRVDTLSNYAGDVCLPGGKYEQSDQNFVNTALRETKEEVGINSDDLQYISTLPPYLVARSGSPMGVTPVVFWLKRNVEVCLNTSEADVSFWTPLNFFLSMHHFSTIDALIPSGHKLTVLMFNYCDTISQRMFLIYGCTANICHCVIHCSEQIS